MTNSIPYYTVRGAAQARGLSEGALRKAINRGELTLVPTRDRRISLLRAGQVERWTPPRGRPNALPPLDAKPAKPKQN